MLRCGPSKETFAAPAKSGVQRIYTVRDEAELRRRRGCGVLSFVRQVRHLSRQLSQFPRASFSISGAS